MKFPKINAILLILGLLIDQSKGQRGQGLQWHWDRNHYAGNNVPGSTSDGNRRTLLIIQEAPYGNKGDLMEVTARVNRAYAKRWGYDYLRFEGVALGFFAWQGTFNRPFLFDILEKAVLYKDNFPIYDCIMMLDASSMIVDFDYDVIDLLPKNKLLANGGESVENFGTLSRNADVQIWDLKHPYAEPVSRLWVQFSRRSLWDESVDCYKVLYKVITDLYGTEERKNLIAFIEKKKINGLKGTLIKEDAPTHYDLDEDEFNKKMPDVQKIAAEICYHYYPGCDLI